MIVTIPSLWQPSSKDLAAEMSPRMFTGRATNAVAAAALSRAMSDAGLTIQRDQVAVITHICVAATGGAGQTPERNVIEVIALPTGVSICPLVDTADNTGAGAGETFGTTWTGQLVLGFNNGILCTSLFSGGAVANTINVGFHGLIIPRGNFQLN